MPPPDTEKEPFEFRLQRYYRAIDMSGLLAPIAVGLFLYLLPGYFPWVSHLMLTVYFMAFLAVLNGINIILYRTLHRKIFFSINRYSYLLFFMEFIAVTGGIRSPIIFLLLFPVIVSAVDLDPRTTRRIGIIVCIYMVLLIFVHPADIFSPVAISQYILELGLFSILPAYMYIIVRETLRQKYERDEASRKFTRLVEVESMKNDFLSIAQHQLRTPLAGIRYALESLRTDGSVSAEARELIDSGIARVGDSLKIVNDMLMTAETGGKGLALHKSPVDLSALVSSLLEDLSYVARQKEVAVHTQLPPSLTVSADMMRLKPAIANIIDNAFKYSPHGKIGISLAENAKKQAVLEVKDNGIGISKEDMSFVFNRFYRGNNAIALEPDQSGVGLYTAKHIIELHGGTVALQSELGKGTTVTVTLPE